MLQTKRRSARAIAVSLAVMMVTAMLAGLIAAPASPASAHAVVAVYSPDALANVALPGDLGQADMQVFVPETGHTIRGYLLDYWRANGAASGYGNPISEPFAASNGYYSQAFEKGVFQFIPELIWTDQPSVSLMPISRMHLEDRLDRFRADGRRVSGGGDRRAGVWRPLNPAGKTAQNAIAQGAIFNETSGHTITGDFLAWYQNHEGWGYLGNPISEPVREFGLTVQYFDGARLFRLDDGTVDLAPMGREVADEIGLDTTPVSGDGLPVYDELLFWLADNPNPLGDPYAPGRKWIEVSLSQQTLWAYQGGTLISQSYVSTGIEPNHTEQGVFHVRYKLPMTDMAGLTDASGRVTELGEDAAADAGAGQIPYVVKDIPDVMYFNYEAEALHGAYWHSNFGTPMSHGCVNLPLDFSHFLYGWAPLGTMVWVHE